MLSGRNIFAQSDANILLFDIVQHRDSLTLTNGKDISQNTGYNNQPAFIDENRLLYARNQNGQTDVALYDLTSKNTSIIHPTIIGSEYSPKSIPGTDHISAVRLDTNGLQRLYDYSLKDSTTVKISQLKIGYYDFYDQKRILATVLTPMAMDLYFINLKTEKDSLLLKNVGRSIQKIPGTRSLSYTLINEEQQLDLYLLDFKTLESYFVCTLPIGIEDYTWLNQNQIILGSRSKLFIYDLLISNEWEEIADLSKMGIKNVTRLAVSPSGKKLALAAEN